MSSFGTYVSGIAAGRDGSVGRCVSSADTSLSLSLSLSCPSSAPDLTTEARRAAVPFVGRETACHPRYDDRHPRDATRDRTRSYAVTNGRQAHCECVCRALGGVAGIPSASGLTARRRWVAVPFVGKITACHPRYDDRRPRDVTRDRTRSYAVTIGRQAHCECVCRAPGGVAGIPSTFVRPAVGAGVMSSRRAGVMSSRVRAVGRAA